MRISRPVVRATIVVCGVVVASSALVSTPVVADPEPTIDEVGDRVGQLHHEAEQASERYNLLTDQISETRSDLRGLRRDLRRSERSVGGLRDQVGAVLAEQVTGSPLGPTGQLLSSGDADAVIEGLGAMQALGSKQAEDLAAYTTANDDLETRRDQLESSLETIADARDAMADERDDFESKAAEAEDLLADLEAEQVEQILDTPHHDETVPTTPETDPETVPGTDPEVGEPAPTEPSEPTTPTTPAAPGGAAASAIAFAKEQLGEPYVYGAAGPDSWDCSGLTSQAYAAAGVSLPRSSSSQAVVGTPVSADQLLPGDLVFFYSPISHVGIYLGGGMLIHAPRPGKGVEIVPMSYMPFATARRVA